MKRVVYHPHASSDLAESALFLERQESGLCNEFFAAVEKTLYPTSPNRLIAEGDNCICVYARLTALYLPSTSITDPDSIS